jgi:hypothetical protein
MTLLRCVILAIAIALGTALAGWWSVPVLGALFGLASRDTERPGTLGACAGALAWGGFLSVLALGGAPVGRFGASLGSSLGLPSFSLPALTVAFAAILAGLSAYLAARMGVPADSRRPRR